MLQKSFIKEQNLEQELLASFEVEELEKRYEMGWIDSVDVNGGVTHNSNSGTTVQAGVVVSISSR